MSLRESASTSTWAESNGYGPAKRYSNTELKSILPRSCGLYLLEFEDGQAYIGISVDLRARLRQHAATHTDIRAFHIRLSNKPTIELRRTERALVHTAEKAGLVLRNREHAAVIVGASHLDAVVSPDEQQVWLESPTAANRADGEVGVEYSDSQLAAHARSFATLEAHPRFAEIVRALGTYLDACVPYPARTEGTFWTVSCHPGSSKTLLLRVSMGMLETFYIWSDPRSGKLEVRFFVDARPLPAPKALQRWKSWRKLSKHVEVGPRGHKSAGAFERTVVVEDIEFLEEALAVPGVSLAAANHALAVMRKRQSGYKSSHCPQLASAGTSALGLRTPTSEHATTTVGQSTDGEPRDAEEDLSPGGTEDNLARQAAKLEAFISIDSTGELRQWLADFVASVLPGWREDVAVHWGLTCMPGTNAGPGRKRLFTLNVGQIEVAYVISSARVDDPALIGAVVVSASELEARTGLTLEELCKTHDELDLHQHGYVAARGDDVTIYWAFEPASCAQLDRLPWREASAVLVDALRTSKCPYAKFHSPMLLDEVNGRVASER